jgi:hypothetical protein
MATTTIKTLTLTLGTKEVQCQLTRAQLVDNPTTEELTTFCGTETAAFPRYQLEIGGFQDYGSVDAVCDILHTAYVADPVDEIDFVLTVGSKTRTGTCKPTADVPFGGDAGSALTFDATLDVIGKPVDGSVPAAP